MWRSHQCERDNPFGPDALGDRRRRNGTVPRLLTPELLDKLQARLTELAPDGGTWSTPKIAAWKAVEIGLVLV